jgi:hypothetical protein
MRHLTRLLFGLALLAACTAAHAAANLITDPSFEQPKERDRWGLVFERWGGWIYEGDGEFRVSDLAHTGAHSLLIVGGTAPKIRARPNAVSLQPGRYRVTAYLRGLDIGSGTWNQTTEFMFAGKYLDLRKNGTFGWTKLSYVGEVTERTDDAGFPSFGLIAPGYLWVDDVTMEQVGPDVPLSPEPLLGAEEAPIAPTGALEGDLVRCPDCGYRNRPEWGRCYACGTKLTAKAKAAGAPTKVIADFEESNPFGAGTVAAEHATHGAKALRLDASYAPMDVPQDWSGYDYLKADVYTNATAPLDLYVEVQDKETRDYWTRVNYVTIVPPGKSTLVIPVKQLYVGEKSRPGRMLLLSSITRFVLSIGEKPEAPLHLDNVRLERDTVTPGLLFDGLYAFDLGLGASPVMEGFTQLTSATRYSKGRGYGLLDAKVWRAFDVLQPDPLYQDFICLESGGLAVDVPNGRYRVLLNIDNPSGFWGEYQTYTKRVVRAEGHAVATDTMDAARFIRKYFRFWDADDSPAENTFDRYQKAYYQEKRFDVEVSDGQLNLDFEGEGYACSLSTVVIFPVEKAAEGERFLRHVEDLRRFHFDTYFKRVLHRPTGDPVQATAAETARGYVAFARDYMKEVYYNDTPFRAEASKPLTGEAFAGEYEPLTLGLMPLRDLGKVTVTARALVGPGGKIPASAIEVGHVSYRLTRVSAEGSVYTIAPRLIKPTNTVAMPAGVTRRFWLTVKVPAKAKPGLYRGTVRVAAEHGSAAEIPVQFRVRAGTLDAVDIPAGPFSYTIDLPWPGPESAQWNEAMARASLQRLREYGFTSFTGMPAVTYQGFKEGQPVLDFRAGDAQMKMAKALGFTMPVVAYGTVSGLNTYAQDTAATQAAGFSDYSLFLRAVFSAVQQHANEQHWLPVYWNLGDEPLGEALPGATENAEAYRKAFPQGPPFFTLFTSAEGKDTSTPHFRLAKAPHAPALNGHDEDAVRALQQAGDRWGFYNGGSRWTYGPYLYKAAHQFGTKFRVAWHWNASAGDPYYALDCREDDYAWATATPDGRLMSTVFFEQLREGLDDYRRLLTLDRLARAKPNASAARAARKVMDARLGAFKLGQRDEGSLAAVGGWSGFRKQVDDAIEALRR